MTNKLRPAETDVVEVGLVGVTGLVAALHADHRIQVGNADGDHARGVVVDEVACRRDCFGDRVCAEQCIVDL